VNTSLEHLPEHKQRQLREITEIIIKSVALSGRVKKGMMLDLAPVGIDKMFILEALGCVLHREGGAAWGNVDLEISGLTENEEELLKTGSPFSQPIRLTNGKYLFTVEATFVITGRGLILYPGFGKNFAKVGSKIQLIRPDQSIIETQIRGITFSDKHDILVGENVKKEDVPLGTEVWLMDTN
jgi:hypothetical protein